MNSNIGFFLLIGAFICFLLSAVSAGWPSWNRVNLIGLGLALWVLTILIAHGGK
jgi:hypothetical protein